MKKLILGVQSLLLLVVVFFGGGISYAQLPGESSFLQAVITADDTVEVQKRTIFDASQSFITEPKENYSYYWDFGDGNNNEGAEVLHVYKDPGKYTVSLKIIDDKIEGNESIVTKEIYVYKKLVVLLTDTENNKVLIDNLVTYGVGQGVYIKIIDSFGSASDFISEEVLTKKLVEASKFIQKATQIAIWTKGNTGLNALARFVQESKKTGPVNFSQKSITVLTDDPLSYTNQIKRQFKSLSPKEIVLTTESGTYLLIDNFTPDEFVNSLKNKGYKYEVISSESFSLRPWNFVSYFLSFLADKGIPDNTIAFLLLLPIIATVVAFMKQMVGLTTMGIYTPIIITLSFLTIGLYFGLLTLVAVLVIGGLTRHLLRKVRLLFIPKMAIVMGLVSLTLILILITTMYLGIFDATFFSLAIFPMVILSTLVEKFVSIKTEKGLASAVILMTETLVVSLIAYVIVGGEMNLGFAVIKFEFIRNIVFNYPELIFVLLGVNVLLGRWSGLRLLEYVRFREVLRHIEEE